MSETVVVEGALSADAIAAVDLAGQLADVLDIGAQLRDALWRVETARLARIDSPAGLIVAGMGGSAIGGALATAVLAHRAARPVVCARSYELPPWATPDTMVLCSSYSGNTEETLACYAAAGALGAPRVVATTGGKLSEAAREDGVPVIPLPAALQPRAAVGYMTVAALEVAASCGAGPSLRSEIDVAAARLEQLAAEWGADTADDALPKQIARGLHGTIPLIAGAGITAPIAYRWKTQINENAKVPAFAHELPELDHNELVGWGGAAELGRFSAVFLADSDMHPNVARRIELTEELIASAAASTRVVSATGERPAERVFSLVLLGDLVSLYMAVLRGIDPTPVPVIEELKSRLAQE